MITQLVQRPTARVDRQLGVRRNGDGAPITHQGRSGHCPTQDLDTRTRRDLEQALVAALAHVPRELAVLPGTSFPLLAAVQREAGYGVARILMLIGALVHADADERRVAEYLIRHRDDLQRGIRSPEKLLSAAATAAYLDARRAAIVEMPAGSGEDVASPGATDTAHDTPAVGEVVVNYLRRAIAPRPLSQTVSALLLDAVPIALALAERHSLNGGTAPSLAAMRSDTRPSARLATHLRGITGDHPIARSLARVMVGPDAAPLETALLWWAAQGETSHEWRPTPVAERWVRDLTRVESRHRAISSAPAA